LSAAPCKAAKGEAERQQNLKQHQPDKTRQSDAGHERQGIRDFTPFSARLRATINHLFTLKAAKTA
jgi:hypothetical protein